MNMPEGYAHVRIAARAAAELHYTPKYPAAFAVGANGPDPFFFYQIWKPARKRTMNLYPLGEKMHTERTGAFLQALCGGVRTGPQIDYALGFLCHYATDATVHPFVYAMCEPGRPYEGPGGHGYLEIGLDSVLHEKDTGDPAVPADDASPLMHGKALADNSALLHDAVLATYGDDVPVEYIADAFYDINRVRRLFPSRFGVRRAVYWLAEPLFGGRGFVTGHVSPRALSPDLPDVWTDPATGAQYGGGLFALLPLAQQRSAGLMGAALKLWRREITPETFAALIGSVSYDTGTETEKSKLPAAKAKG